MPLNLIFATLHTDNNLAIDTIIFCILNIYIIAVFLISTYITFKLSKPLSVSQRELDIITLRMRDILRKEEK